MDLYETFFVLGSAFNTMRSLARYHRHNRARYRAVFTYLGHHVTQGGQGKYNMCRCCWRYRGCYFI